jgi:hypothetical protein
VRWRPIVIVFAACAVVVGLGIWFQHARLVGHWLQVHMGTVNEPGLYYGFWSGFGSDLEEFGILGAIGAAIYSLFRKYNCHEPGSVPLPRPADVYLDDLFQGIPRGDETRVSMIIV